MCNQSVRVPWRVPTVHTPALNAVELTKRLGHVGYFRQYFLHFRLVPFFKAVYSTREWPFERPVCSFVEQHDGFPAMVVALPLALEAR